MYKFGRKKKTPNVKHVERKNIESTINSASTRAIHIEVRDIDTTADYSRIVGERMK